MPFFGLTGSANTSKTTNQQTGTFNNTTTAVVPDWITTPVQAATDRVSGLFNLNPSGLVSGADPLQQQAARSAAGLGSTPVDLSGAQSLAQGAKDTAWLQPYMQADTPFASGGKAYNYVNNYLNPYLRDVVDSSAADLDSHAGQVRAQQSLDLAGSGAFGGSGAALTQSMTEGELARARASTLSGLRSHAYDTALAAAAGDADRATQARVSNTQAALQDSAQKVGWGLQGQQTQLNVAGQQADWGFRQADDQRANIGVQAGLGQTMRDITQQQVTAPITNAEHVVALLNNLPLGLFAGQNQQGVSTETGTSKTKGASIGASFGMGKAV